MRWWNEQTHEMPDNDWKKSNNFLLCTSDFILCVPNSDSIDRFSR